MSEMELAVHDMKNAREIMNVKHLGNMSHVEKEMEEACNFLSASGRIMMSARSQKDAAGSGGNNYITGDKNTPRGGNYGSSRAPIAQQNSKRGVGRSSN